MKVSLFAVAAVLTVLAAGCSHDPPSVQGVALPAAPTVTGTFYSTPPDTRYRYYIVFASNGTYDRWFPDGSGGYTDRDAHGPYAGTYTQEGDGMTLYWHGHSMENASILENGNLVCTSSAHPQGMTEYDVGSCYVQSDASYNPNDEAKWRDAHGFSNDPGKAFTSSSDSAPTSAAPAAQPAPALSPSLTQADADFQQHDWDSAIDGYNAAIASGLPSATAIYARHRISLAHEYAALGYKDSGQLDVAYNEIQASVAADKSNKDAKRLLSEIEAEIKSSLTQPSPGYDSPQSGTSQDSTYQAQASNSY